MATAVKAAKHICLSPSRFRDLVDAGVFERMPPGKYDLTTVREAYCRYAQKVMQGRSDDGGKALSQRRGRLAEAQTVAVELKTAILSGEYVRLASVIEIVEEHYAVVRERVLSTPGKSADALTPFTPKDREEIMTILRDEAYDALTDLSTEAFVRAKMESHRARAKPNGDAAEAERASA